MAVHGYVTHAARNRRHVFFLALLYVVAFEIIGAFVAIFPLLYIDTTHTVLSDPLGYFQRYGLPMAGLAIIVFGWLLVDHAAAVARDLRVRFVERAQEPRFVKLAEEACTLQGVRVPRFGVIEASEPNALSAGEGARGLIVVTRGLLDLLDDEELAAVLAHEAAHIRLGDTQALAANDALMRTAELMQRRNPLRIEDKRQLLLLLLAPPIAVLLLVSGALSMFALWLARYARRGVELARDHVADGEAVRATHFPEALISAVRKVAGRGAFAGCLRHAPLLFDGFGAGASPAVAEARIAAISTLGAKLMDPARMRLDTRARSFGKGGYEAPAPARPFGRKPSPGASDRDAMQEMRAALAARSADPQLRGGWGADDGRNLFGIKPEMALPAALALAVGLGLLIYREKDAGSVLHALNPARFAEIAQQVNAGPFCSGPCAGFRNSGFQPVQAQGAAATSPPDNDRTGHVLSFGLTGLFVAFAFWRQALHAKRQLGKGLPVILLAMSFGVLLRIFSGGF